MSAAALRRLAARRAGRANARANRGNMILGAPTTKAERRKRVRMGRAFATGGKG